MSTVAAREPARAGDVARHYLRLLGSGRGVVVLLPVVVVGAVLSGESFHGFGGLPLILWLMAGLPFVQWGIAERSGALDEAMPLDTVRHGLVRVACGTLWAATALAPAIGFLALRWYPGSAGIGAAALGLYPVLLLAAGLTYHLLGAAAWLCGSRRGAALGAIAFLALVPLLASRSFLARGERLLALRETPAPGELLAWTSAQALWTAAALAAVWLAATAPRLEARAGGGRRGAARAWIGRRRGVLPQRRVRAGALRRPAPLHRVLWREIVIVRLSMAGMGAALLLVTLWINPMLDAAAANPASSPWFGAIYSFSIAWSIAVWLPFAVSGRRVVDPFPVSDVTHRLARIVAGAVWLEVAVLLALAGRAANVAGWTPRSALLAGGAGPWAGIACGALLLYLLGSVPLLVAREHLLGWFLPWISGLLVAIPIAKSIAPHGRFSFATALSAFGPRPGAWVGAMLLWTAIIAAVAAGAAAWGVALERLGPSQLR